MRALSRGWSALAICQVWSIGACAAPLQTRAETVARPPPEDRTAVPPTDAPALGCPALFALDARGRWHALTGQRYLIDASGRPVAAEANLPPVEADDPRSSTCQSAVGRWGDAEHPEDDYDGGHMIGHRLGGWGGRANLVPQQTNFNQGNWSQLERAVAMCSALDAATLSLHVEVVYRDDRTLVPTTMAMTLRDARSGDAITLTFANERLGGDAGTQERLRGAAWLAAHGCR